jgi:hypothetical protein
MYLIVWLMFNSAAVMKRQIYYFTGTVCYNMQVIRTVSEVQLELFTCYIWIVICVSLFSAAAGSAEALCCDWQFDRNVYRRLRGSDTV